MSKDYNKLLDKIIGDCNKYESNDCLIGILNTISKGIYKDFQISVNDKSTKKSIIFPNG